jgi:hypothetical protein
MSQLQARLGAYHFRLLIRPSANPQIGHPPPPGGNPILEDEMRKLVTTAMAAVLVLGLSCWCFGYETDFDDLQAFDRNLPGWKFGRGVVNILSAPHEFFAHTTNNAIKGAYNGSYNDGLHGYLAGSLNGFIAGIGPGLYWGFRRITTGALEILTFWKPEYGPTIDPQYGTHNRAFGEQDYYNPNNFWYNGP